MERTVEAIYENGVLRLLEPIPFENKRKVTVTISDAVGHPLLASPEEWSESANDDISLDEVRRALSTIHGSLSDAIVSERRDR